PDVGELRSRVTRHTDALKRAMANRLKHDTAILTSARRALMPRDAERALREPIQNLDGLRQDLKIAADNQLDDFQSQLKELGVLHAAHHPKRVMQRRGEKLDHARALLERAGENALQHATERLQSLTSLIRTLGPESTFARGFSITLDAEGNIIKDVSGVKQGELLTSKFAQGELKSRVEE
ncbi:MAG: exodeoxyribonuclease VII large subunit, partial [Akkermansiaceae bacterium]